MSSFEPEEPERWIVSTEAPPELRALLDVARREGPSLLQKTSLGARLGLSASQVLTGLSAKGVAAGTIVLAATTGAAFGLYAGRAPEPIAAPRPAAVYVAPPLPAPGVASSDVAFSVVAPPDPPPEQPAETAAGAPPSAAPAPPTSKPPSEASLIRGARAALPSGTSQARRLLERHRRLYPQGQLAEEREVLLIEVLEREGRAAEASARAAEFRQQNPESPHRPTAP